ncbi:molybdenum cofactor biosynthesis protein 1-like isoform X2 [Ctenocephalides felis]|nr:molybdenum cofactor biosynthesis protein 1-like isoform X2 [Ctenocephalides felis]
MPAEGVQLSAKDQLLSTDEVLYIAKLFVEQGVDKIRLTGGEPTVRKDLLHIVENLKKIPGLKTVAITTNGLMLTRQLVPLQRAGLDLLNISLDTLKPQKYELITRRKGWERVIAGIDLAIQLGYKPKVNCVVMKDFNADEVLDFVQFTEDRNVDVRFIEYMPFSGNKWKTEKMVAYKDLVSMIRSKWSNFKPLENSPNDTSKAYAVPGFRGQVGFITSMSEHFCGTCNRLRVTADGNLKVCLFGNAEVSLRDAIRAGTKHDDLVALIGATVFRKKKQHADIKINRIHPQSPLNTNLSHLFAHNMVHQNYIRTFSSLTHVNSEGEAHMVDISGKQVTKRNATATGKVYVGSEIAQLIKENGMKKGDVLSVAKLAGVMSSKKTSDLIPLCHNINLSHVDVQTVLNDDFVVITANVQCEGKTGVEMEALTAVAITALTIYDMCKAVSHDMLISDIKLVKKTGGKSDYCDKKKSGEAKQLKYNTEPIIKKEPFFPVYV